MTTRPQSVALSPCLGAGRRINTMRTLVFALAFSTAVAAVAAAAVRGGGWAKPLVAFAGSLPVSAAAMIVGDRRAKRLDRSPEVS